MRSQGVLTHKRNQRCRWIRIVLIFFVVQLIVNLACLLHISNIWSLDNAQLPQLTNRVFQKKIKSYFHFQKKEDDNLRKRICPVVPPYLKGQIKGSFQAYHWDQIERRFFYLEDGGRFRPRHCISRHRVAIIVPYRGRKDHLKIFINNMHEFLENQELDYGIFVVELAELTDFNRGLALNVGFMESSKLYDYQCFIFHDVDLMPENGHNLYTCSTSPKHMSVAVDVMNYTLPYPDIFGGVTAMTREQFLQVNGYSNKFFGWGGEDDDLYLRLKANNMTILRHGIDVARYKMLKHDFHGKNADRFHCFQEQKYITSIYYYYVFEWASYAVLQQLLFSLFPLVISFARWRYYLLRSAKKKKSMWKRDGINSLKYKILKTETRKLFTYILFDINEFDPVYYTDTKMIVEENLKIMKAMLHNSSTNPNDTLYSQTIPVF